MLSTNNLSQYAVQARVYLVAYSETLGWFDSGRSLFETFQSTKLLKIAGHPAQPWTGSMSPASHQTPKA
jgi:hypothetical protein